ncbi:hypothetical protein FCN13_07150 [Pseudomonas sp. UMC631]|nr:hypothetical protein [Pseudomonas sp. UMA643]NTY18724.1 hypothetical protein [Pseudomonas sp. UMC3103]NTY23972.1 hypothetical protein [Pseudomonas sp. UMA603]NTY29181.1 hypothetical protein [Pseudomonas sp. UMC3129]NTY53381.1 hypothetical protein [Pseudomonas sp. UMC631]NTY65733.1 hypothetical protein [Pseudomonas sp. UMC3106]NUA33753.1 hypothetical protein [Pseudomonas sp. UMA601]
MLSLALSVSTSCAQLAAATPQLDSQKAGRQHQQQELAQKAKIRERIKRAMAALGQLRDTLEASCKIMLEQKVPDSLINEQPFTEIVQTLRQLEEAVPADSALSNLPVIGEEYDALRRNLAKVRAMAVQNEILFKQQITVPEVFQSDVSGEGLKSLADLGTERLHRLVS